jgi:hypothetical protein
MDILTMNCIGWGWHPWQGWNEAAGERERTWRQRQRPWQVLWPQQPRCPPSRWHSPIGAPSCSKAAPRPPHAWWHKRLYHGPREAAQPNHWCCS